MSLALVLLVIPIAIFFVVKKHPKNIFTGGRILLLIINAAVLAMIVWFIIPKL